MNALKIAAIAGVIAAALCCAQANAQDTGDDSGLDLGALPLDNVSSGALNSRRPGLWITQALNRTRGITNTSSSDVDFIDELITSMLQAFLDAINQLIASLTSLLDLSSLFGSLVDASDIPAQPQVATASPSMFVPDRRSLPACIT